MDITEPTSPEAAVGRMSMRDMVRALTGGRPYIFVIMAYGARWDLYERIQRIASREFSVACVRADDVKSSGHDLLAKIHLLISRAELVIAEISERTENVFYEIGYAVGIQKVPLLLMEKGKELPVDLKGLEVLQYKTDREGVQNFEAELTAHLRQRLNSEIALLRDMLEPSVSEPAYIISSPKYPGEHSRIRGQVYDSRTFGDHLGILGLITAWGSMRGESQGLELVSAQHCPPDLLDQQLNLYLIGSEKVNTPAATMLERLQEGRTPNWRFDPLPPFTRNNQDWPCALWRGAGDTCVMVRGKTEPRGPQRQEVWVEDYGIIVRGPHPAFPACLVLILAGAHSLGTGAACLAATRSALIQQIRSRLPEGVLEDKKQTFWVLVKGTANKEDGLLDPEDVTIEEAGVYR